MRLFVILLALLVCVYADKLDFANFLVEREGAKRNLFEYYGSQKMKDGRSTYFTLSASYEYKSNLVRLYTNIKHPATTTPVQETSNLVSHYEIDLAKNSLAILNPEEGSVNFTDLMKVYDIQGGKVVKEDSCMLDFSFKYRLDKPIVTINTQAIADEQCTPYPEYRFSAVREETNPETKDQDHKLLSNMYHLSEILGTAGFRDSNGSWISPEEEIEQSEAKYADFFYIGREDDLPKVHVQPIFQDYDVLGDTRFHAEEPGWKRKDKEPRFIWSAQFFEAGNKANQNDVLDVQQEFDIDLHYLDTNPHKLRLSNSSRSVVSMNNDKPRTDCNLSFEMKIKSDYVNWYMDDDDDKCVASDIKGTYALRLTDQEKFEEMVEDEIIEQSIGDGTSKAAQQMQKQEDEELVEEMIQRFDHLDAKEKKQLENLVEAGDEGVQARYHKAQGKQDYVAQMKEARKQIYDYDYVDYDFEQPRNDEEYYMRGRTPNQRGGKDTNDRKDKRKARDVKEEEKGALYAILAMTGILCIFLVLRYCYEKSKGNATASSGYGSVEMQI